MVELTSNTTTNTTTQTHVDSRMNSDQLKYELSHFTGTEQWYRHNVVRDLLYTGGVKHFSESAGDHGAYWFLDTVALYIYPLLKKEPFLVINLQVNNDYNGVIKVDDGNDNEVFTKTISYTDVQEGVWKFYLTDNVMLLTSEY